MRSYTLFAPAKINLFLEILGDRPDGFHELVMILQSISLGDYIHLQANGTQQIRLTCSRQDLPADESNLAYRAARLMTERFPQAFANYGGLNIDLEKQIPIAAGLAGGSADAAAVLVGIDLLWQLGLTQPELQSLAAELGSDIPFCIGGGTALATGRGEKLDPLPDVDNFWVVLAKDQTLAVPTPWAYQTYRQQFQTQYLPAGTPQRIRAREIHAGPLVQAIQKRDAMAIALGLHNDLEKVVLPHYPGVANLRQVLAEAGGLGTMMSGSGPTVFTFCASQESAEQVKATAESHLANPNVQFWLARLIGHGIQVID
ncbi:4-(cytidine 5'-diphospho)-2-C-methyl-D-erythritol kinase [Synechocystis sp. LKSZ1]|uniref:4-(cytidine 5'-diphospho)-2-C-methyl-D-erythritol kinase n=1 Tax=Synechocystis sp. LKSZ1 TaxID=3144951 RepID=UPI00336BCB20